LGTILALFLLGRKLYGERAAFLGSLVLLTTHQFIYNHCARSGELDSALLFFSTSALLLFLLAIKSSSRGLLCLAFASVGLVGMVKHIGFVPQLLVIMLLLLAITRGWKRFTASDWLTAGGLLLLVVVPWHLAQWIRFGATFPESYILGEVVARAAGDVGFRYEPKLGVWFYPFVLKNGFFPWSILLPLCVGLPLLEKGGEKRRDTLALIAWMGFSLLIVTLSEGKNFWYALPILPPASLLIGRFLDRSLEEAGNRSLVPAVAAAAVVAALSTSTASTHNPFAVRARHEMVEIDLLGRLGTRSGMMLLAAAAAFALVTWFLRRHPAGRWAPTLVLMSLALLQVASPLKFTKTRNPVDRIVSAAIKEQRPKEAFAVALPGKVRRPIRHLFYFRQLGPKTKAVKNSELIAWRRTIRRRRLLITTIKDARRLQADAQRFGKRRTFVLTREPPFALVRLMRYRNQPGGARASQPTALPAVAKRNKEIKDLAN
jgi:4-amino-4-deoxy-L-arabinose transferase-like glycosyltransferase